MDTKRINLDKEKKEQFKAKAKFNLLMAKDWIERNKYEIVAVSTVVVPSVAGVTAKVMRRQNLKKEQRLKDLYCYDRSLGHYWKLKKPLSNNDWIEINRRRDHGETLGDILDSMKVLK